MKQREEFARELTIFLFGLSVELQVLTRKVGEGELNCRRVLMYSEIQNRVSELLDKYLGKHHDPIASQPKPAALPPPKR